MPKLKLMLYECGICGQYHPWSWDGDCREDANRYADVEAYAGKMGVTENAIEVLSWEDRCDADGCNADDTAPATSPAATVAPDSPAASPTHPASCQTPVLDPQPPTADQDQE